MNLRNFISTEGAFLSNFSANKPFYFLKNDPMNHNLWKSLNKKSSLNRTKKLEQFKARFLKN
jgi:hypothetical protein